VPTWRHRYLVGHQGHNMSILNPITAHGIVNEITAVNQGVKVTLSPSIESSARFMYVCPERENDCTRYSYILGSVVIVLNLCRTQVVVACSDPCQLLM
jgi:hypothetical protein